MTFPGEAGGFLWRRGGLAVGRSPQSLLVSCVVGGEPAAPGSPRAQSWYQGQPLCVSVLPRQAGPGITE